MITILGGFTPHCGDCGVALCYDISEEEYEKNFRYWDNWTCSDCNGFKKHRQSLRQEKGLQKRNAR